MAEKQIDIALESSVQACLAAAQAAKEAAEAANTAAQAAKTAAQNAVPSTGAVVDYMRKSTKDIGKKLNSSTGYSNTTYTYKTSYQTLVDLTNIIFFHSSISIQGINGTTVEVTINDTVKEFNFTSPSTITIGVPEGCKIKRFKVRYKCTSEGSFKFGVWGNDSQTGFNYFNW